MNWFYRGFNRIYNAVEQRYIGVVSWMVRRPRAMVCLFFAVVGCAAVIFARHPTAFLPTEDQGYCVLVAQLPAGASQLRVRQVSADIDAVLKNVPGIKGWVTSGGFSDPDSANLSNVVTKYVMYNDWDKRPADLSQNRIVADLRARLQSIRKAQFDVLIPPPIPGLGQAGGFQMMVEDRAGIGLGQLEKTVQQILLAADKEAGLARRHHHLQFEKPATSPRDQPHDGRIAGRHYQRCFSNPADELGINLRQPVQQV